MCSSAFTKIIENKTFQLFPPIKVLVLLKTFKNILITADEKYAKTIKRRVMTQAVLKKYSTFADYGKNTINLVESIKNYISNNHCPNLSMDVSHLNIIEASKVTILCSTYHWAKYPKGKISWKISSEEIKELVSPLNLGNIRLITVR